MQSIRNNMSWSPEGFFNFWERKTYISLKGLPSKSFWKSNGRSTTCWTGYFSKI